MAVTTTKSTLNVIVQDANNGDVTFKLDNPLPSVTGLSTVKTYFEPFFASGNTFNRNLLCTKTGYDLVAVLGAEKVTTTVTKDTLV